MIGTPRAAVNLASPPASPKAVTKGHPKTIDLKHAVWNNENRADGGYGPAMFFWGGGRQVAAKEETHASLRVFMWREFESLGRAGKGFPFAAS